MRACSVCGEIGGHTADCSGARARFADQIITAVTIYKPIYEPTRSERLQLARRQAEVGIDAIKADDVKAARAFLVDALDHLEQIKL
jgi:chloramphenicol 3-O-phosphotransferase